MSSRDGVASSVSDGAIPEAARRHDSVAIRASRHGFRAGFRLFICLKVAELAAFQRTRCVWNLNTANLDGKTIATSVELGSVSAVRNDVG